ncbi:hypothetical protein K438DRAFT_1787695 [Mycena galopus ATCC 62051]|nr:hypothetical protein K438DRAFT_1787695 [Mycena galopus ATCC 62051]
MTVCLLSGRDLNAYGLKAGSPRSKQDTITDLEKQLERAVNGAPSAVGDLATGTGSKDKYFQHFRLIHCAQRRPWSHQLVNSDSHRRDLSGYNVFEFGSRLAILWGLLWATTVTLFPAAYASLLSYPRAIAPTGFIGLRLGEYCPVKLSPELSSLSRRPGLLSKRCCVAISPGPVRRLSRKNADDHFHSNDAQLSSGHRRALHAFAKLEMDERMATLSCAHPTK